MVVYLIKILIERFWFVGVSMTIFRTSIEIKASQEKVFEVLCQLENYPKWHPSIRSIQGDLSQGKILAADFGSEKRALNIPLEITVLEIDKKLEWQGSLFKQGKLRKVFLVRHAFYLEALENGLVKFTNEEEFSPLLSMLVNRIQEKFLNGYEQVNKALKSYCETPNKVIA